MKPLSKKNLRTFFINLKNLLPKGLIPFNNKANGNEYGVKKLRALTTRKLLGS